MNLQIEAVKSIFSGLDEYKQYDLLTDLMRISKIDSIVRIDSITKLNGVPLGNHNEEKLWREKFEEFIMPFLVKFLRIIDKEYMNNCFEVFKILAKKSIGSKYYSQDTTGDKNLYAYCKREYPDYDLFYNDIEKQMCFMNDIFINADIELIDIGFYIDEISLYINFTDFLVLLCNDVEKA